MYRETLHRMHTRAIFLAAHARTPDVSTHLAPGLDDLFVCLKSHSIIGHVFVECSFDPDSSYFLLTCNLTDDTCCHLLRCRLESDQTRVQLRSEMDCLATWPVGSQTQVMSPSSASTLIASTRRSTFHPETCISRQSTTRRSPRLRTFICLDFLGLQAAASIRQQAGFPLCRNLVHQGLASRLCWRIVILLLGRTSITETCADMDRETVVSSLFESVSKVKLRDRQKAVTGEKLGSAKDYTTAEEDVEVKHWKKRNSDIALFEINQEFESQWLQLQQANQWADQAQRDKISLYGELEMRNRLFR